MANGAFFVDSGDKGEGSFQKAYSVDPKAVDRISTLTMAAGVLGVARYFIFPFAFLSFPSFLYY